MASTYSALLNLELIGSGEQSNSWGNTTNNNLQYGLEYSIAGVYTKNLSAAFMVFSNLSKAGFFCSFFTCLGSK